MNGLVADETLIADLDAQDVKEDQGLDRFKWASLPGGDIIENTVGDSADQIRRDVNAAQMSDDLPNVHTAGIHGNDLFVETRKAPLIFGNELRIEARLPITGDLQIDAPTVGCDRLSVCCNRGGCCPALRWPDDDPSRR